MVHGATLGRLLRDRCMGVGTYCRSSRGKNWQHTRTYVDLEENMPLFIVRVEAEFPTRDQETLHDGSNRRTGFWGFFLKVLKAGLATVWFGPLVWTTGVHRTPFGFGHSPGLSGSDTDGSIVVGRGRVLCAGKPRHAGHSALIKARAICEVWNSGTEPAQRRGWMTRATNAATRRRRGPRHCGETSRSSLWRRCLLSRCLSWT
jgi:hypothetical protein